MSLRSLASLAPLLALGLIACGDNTTTHTPDTSASDAADATVSGDTSATTSATDTSVGDITIVPCDPLAENTCGTGKTCSFIANESSATCVTAGQVPPEQPCGGENRCSSGVCLALNGTASLCYQFCGENADCGATGTCLDLTNAPFDICKIEGIYQNCNLLTQDCSDDTKSCYAVATENDPICLETGTKGVAAACDKASDCLESLACVNDVCRTICDPEAAPDPCGEGFVCNPFFANAGYCDPK
ncbi:MAG: hypothetical protein U1F43_17400 [Myxococcota bacterium]